MHVINLIIIHLKCINTSLNDEKNDEQYFEQAQNIRVWRLHLTV